jgi:hypothetical protein
VCRAATGCLPQHSAALTQTNSLVTHAGAADPPQGHAGADHGCWRCRTVSALVALVASIDLSVCLTVRQRQQYPCTHCTRPAGWRLCWQPSML